LTTNIIKQPKAVKSARIKMVTLGKPDSNGELFANKKILN